MKGTKALNGAVGWIGTILLALGLTAGISLPLVFHTAIWLSVLIGALVVAGVLAEGSFRLADEQREAIEDAQEFRSSTDHEKTVGYRQRGGLGKIPDAKFEGYDAVIDQTGGTLKAPRLHASRGKESA